MVEQEENVGCCQKRTQRCRKKCSSIGNGCSQLGSCIANVDCKGCAKDMCSKENIKKKIPILKWLPNYGYSELQGDAIAGMTVALTVIPQGLALAEIAHLPPQYGLYSAFVGCIIYCFLGTAKDITLGPTAIMSLMTAEFATFHDHSLYGVDTLAIVLTLFCGFAQLAMGVLRAGFLVDYISYPVISGFTSAAAIIIAMSQVKKWLGIEGIPREFMHQVYALGEKIGETKLWDALMGVVVILVLYLMKKLKTIEYKNDNVCLAVKIARKLAWFLGTARNAVVMIATGVIAYLMLNFGIDLFTLTGHVRPGLPPVEIPKFTVEEGNFTMTTSEVFSYIGSGFVIVPILSLIETIAIGQAFAKKNNYRIDANQELVAIGISNIVGCFVKAYPVTGSFSRTAVNSQSGVRTPAGGLFTASMVLLALGVLTPLFQYIPSASLACVIILAVLDMINFQMPVNLWKVKKIDLVPWVITFVCSFIIGIEFGIMLGVGSNLLMLLYPWARPQLKVIREENAPILRTSDAVVDTTKDVIVMQLDQGLRYPSIEYVKENILDESCHDNRFKSVVFDCSHISDLDFSAAQALKQVVMSVRSRGTNMVFVGLQPNALAVLENVQIKDVGVYDTIEEGIQAIRESDLDEMGMTLTVTANEVEMDKLAAASNGVVTTDNLEEVTILSDEAPKTNNIA